jgi:hypothetical protein
VARTAPALSTSQAARQRSGFKISEILVSFETRWLGTSEGDGSTCPSILAGPLARSRQRHRSRPGWTGRRDKMANVSAKMRRRFVAPSPFRCSAADHKIRARPAPRPQRACCNALISVNNGFAFPLRRTLPRCGDTPRPSRDNALPGTIHSTQYLPQKENDANDWTMPEKGCKMAM